MSNKFDFAINGISSTSDGTTKVNGQLVATQDWILDNIDKKTTGYTYDDGEVNIESPGGVDIEGVRICLEAYDENVYINSSECILLTYNPDSTGGPDGKAGVFINDERAATQEWVLENAGGNTFESIQIGDGAPIHIGEDLDGIFRDASFTIETTGDITLTNSGSYPIKLYGSELLFNDKAVATQEWINNHPINETVNSLNETIIVLNSTVEGLKNQITDGSFDLDYAYVDNNSAYTLNGRGKCDEDDIVVGSHQFKIPVKYVENLAFNGDSTITSLKFLGTNVIIKDSSNYTEGAFRNCVNLSSVDFTGVSEIGWHSFRNNSKLSNINLKGVKRIGGHAFHDSGNAIQIETADVVERIEEGAFMNVRIKGAMVLPSTLDYVGVRAFSGIKATTVTFNSTPSTLYSSAFENCSSITDIYVPWTKGEVAGAPWGATNATIHYAEPDVSVDTETGELTIGNGEFNSTNSELTLVNATYNADTGELII